MVCVVYLAVYDSRPVFHHDVCYGFDCKWKNCVAFQFSVLIFKHAAVIENNQGGD